MAKELAQCIPLEVIHNFSPPPNLRNRARRLIPFQIRETARDMVDTVAIKLFPIQAVTVAEVGAKFKLHCKRDRYRLQTGGYEGQYSSDIMAAIKESGENVNFLDIGAAQGLYTLLAAVSRASVVAVEPDHELVQDMLENIQLNSTKRKLPIQVLDFALSNENGITEFYTDGRNGRAPSLVQTHDQRLIEWTWMATLDMLIETNAVPVPTIVKLDVEGAEEMVLKGGENLFRSVHKPAHLFVEIHEQYLPKFGTTAENVWNYITGSLEYHPHRIYPRNEYLCHFIAKTC